MKRLLSTISTFALALALQGCVIIPIGLPTSTGYHEVKLVKGHGGKVALIDVTGTIEGGGAGSGLFDSDSSVVALAEKLALAKKDGSVKAVVLRVDSPGGGVTASDIMYRELGKFTKDTGKPIYVSMQDLAASGGFYISMAADKVYANPTTVTGSIGVIAMFPSVEGLGSKVGVQMQVVKSGANKDGGSMWKSLTPEQSEIFQSVINDMYEKFVDVVAKNRTKLSREEIKRLADGRIYTADQAAAAGLIDGVKYLDEVIAEASTATGGSPEPTVVTYRTSMGGSMNSIYAKGSNPLAAASAPPAQPQINVFNVEMNGLASNPGSEVFNYRWVP